MLLAWALTTRIVRLRCDRRELLLQLDSMAVGSLPLVLVTALFTGAIMVLQAAPLVERYQAHALLGWGAGFGTIREVGPLLVALMVSGRVGANNSAQLASMVVTDQVAALRTLAIDPLELLVVPRFIGIVATLVLSTGIAILIALAGASLAGYLLVAVAPLTFYGSITGGLLSVADLTHGMLKSAGFGVVIGLTSCFTGLRTTGGAEGVGRAVSQSVVGSAFAIFAVDALASVVLP